MIVWNSQTLQTFLYDPEIHCLDVDRRHGERDLQYLFLSFLALERIIILSTPHTCLILYHCEKENFLCHCQSRTRLLRPRNLIIISFFRWEKSLRNHHFLLQRTVLASWTGLMKVCFRRRKKWKQRGVGERAREISYGHEKEGEMVTKLREEIKGF